MKERYQITQYADWFYFYEIEKILKQLKEGEKIEIIKLSDEELKNE